VLRFAPSLLVTEAEIDRAVAMLGRILNRFVAVFGPGGTAGPPADEPGRAQDGANHG
jgi:hypothetical protein